MSNVVKLPPKFRVVAGRPLSVEQQRERVRDGFTLAYLRPEREPEQEVESFASIAREFAASMGWLFCAMAFFTGVLVLAALLLHFDQVLQIIGRGVS